ncbi:hypothetical protein M446_4989 [Methylobacterium sp. 4-46]|nr:MULTISPECIES: hypothetical protein [Methylobacterium]ACA19317.1 hypothetical protein M446_4989 [Methylobacterium sp. 4-46]WFT78519.1 hypothetical protein QA634_25075 [Methylobacterium nodulans]
MPEQPIGHDLLWSKLVVIILAFAASSVVGWTLLWLWALVNVLRRLLS